MAFALTIKQSYELIHHVGRLPCTLSFRFAYDAFQKQVEFTPDEIKQFQIKVNPDTFDIECNDTEYTVEYASIPEGVAKAMREWSERYDVDDMKNNPLVQDALAVFKLVLNPSSPIHFRKGNAE